VSSCRTILHRIDFLNGKRLTYGSVWKGEVMLKSFRFWCFAAGAGSLLITVLHVVSGGPEFHDPALASALPDAWKAAFSTVWHEVTALLLLNGVFLLATGMTWRKNTLALLLILLLNMSFTALFLGYGLGRLGNPWILLQWILFAGLSVMIALALLLPEQHTSTDATAEDQTAFAALPQATFADTYITRTVSHPTAMAAAQHVFNSSPAWVTSLLNLRNRIVSVFGLVHKPPAEIGAIGMFPIVSQTADRVVLGFDDKHLDFRIVVNLRQAENAVLLTTLVQPHNVFGRLYLAVVKPFHRLIVPTMLSRAA
jgi:Protein of unknown function (DUF2867)